MRHRGNIVLVTGSLRGIGRVIGEAFGKEGARVVFNYRRDDEKSRERKGQIRAEFEEYMYEPLFLRADVTDTGQVENMVQELVDRWGCIDILVNNAGGYPGPGAPIEEMTDENWHSYMDVNLHGVLRLCRAVVGHMKDAGGGSIINITASRSTAMGRAHYSHYCAAKAGVNGFSRAAARELAGDNIRVNCVAPGWVPSDREGEKTEKIPLGRFGSGRDVASSVLFLASSEADWITGQVLHVNGGVVSGG